MTAQEALAQALLAIDWEAVTDTTEVTVPNADGIRTFESEVDTDNLAAAILDALPEGWALCRWPHEDWYDGPEMEVATAMSHGDGMKEGAQQERERLRKAILGPHDDHECSPGFCADLILMAVDDELDPEDDR
jgi:hypothetical protein